MNVSEQETTPGGQGGPAKADADGRNEARRIASMITRNFCIGKTSILSHFRLDITARQCFLVYSFLLILSRHRRRRLFDVILSKKLIFKAYYQMFTLFDVEAVLFFI